jgi:hypothetical protein
MLAQKELERVVQSYALTTRTQSACRRFERYRA